MQREADAPGTNANASAGGHGAWGAAREAQNATETSGAALARGVQT